MTLTKISPMAGSVISGTCLSHGLDAGGYRDASHLPPEGDVRETFFFATSRIVTACRGLVNLKTKVRHQFHILALL